MVLSSVSSANFNFSWEKNSNRTYPKVAKTIQRYKSTLVSGCIVSWLFGYPAMQEWRPSLRKYSTKNNCKWGEIIQMFSYST